MVEIEKKLLIKIEERLSLLLKMYDMTINSPECNFLQRQAAKIDKSRIEKLISELNKLINN